ncbi:hypothetical protein [Bacillus kwashiorkori]|uniref:hypothetical protein n=1 Tax=Bacillus kwashiorkori TaxID=1522318 RepID=UPI0007805563|nr:hypothetical protein [Bacillus kwashiorkori]
MDKIYELLLHMQKEQQEFKEAVLGKFVEIDERFDKIDAKFVEVDERFDKIDAKFVEVDERFDEVNGNYKNMEKLIKGIGNQFEYTNRLRMQDIDFLSEKITKLEKELYLLKNK